LKTAGSVIIGQSSPAIRYIFFGKISFNSKSKKAKKDAAAVP